MGRNREVVNEEESKEGRTWYGDYKRMKGKKDEGKSGMGEGVAVQRSEERKIEGRN